MAGLGIASTQPANPDFSGNPLGALGFVLQSLSAGIQGQEQPIEKFRREQQAAEQQRLKSASDQLVIMGQARDVLQGLPPEQRKPVADNLVNLLGEDARPLIDAVSAEGGSDIGSADFQQALQLAGGNRKIAGQLLGQESFRKGLRDATDARQGGAVQAKVQSIIQSLGGNIPKGPSGLPNVPLSTLLTFSNALPDKDAMKLTKEEIPTLERTYGTLAGDLGLETPQLREFGQKEAIRTRNDLALKQSGPAAGPSEKPSFGTSEEGLALDTMMQYKQALEGGNVDPGLEDKARVAAHILQQQKFLRTPSGELLTSTPGIPEGFPIPGAARNPNAAANPTAEMLGTGPTIAKANVPTDNKRVGLAIQAITGVADLLDEAKAKGETITGAVGQAKALGGGIARTVGIPVSDLARQLRTKVEEVKALAAPAVLGESGRSLSDADRKRLDTLIGSVDYTMDDTALRGALSEVLKLLEKSQGTGAADSGPAEGTIAVNRQTGEQLVFHGGKWVPNNGK